MTRLLLLEDEPRISGFIERGLRAEGYDVELVETGGAAIQTGLSGQHDIIVLDVMLPDISGMDVCERLRAAGIAAPIMMLTARDAEEDIVEGLGRGADDYLAKPFSFDVFLARLSALLRRGVTPLADEPLEHVSLAGLTLDPARREGWLSEVPLDLTRREFDVLWLLVSDTGRVHSRERILSAAWGANADPMTNVVDVYIARLRKKLSAPGAPQIATVRGIGYRISG
ncbi:MAG: response regulator transcription factor [Pseudomonadota bacterium]